jgi:hypothetical protein
MWDPRLVKEIVKALMESGCYFRLTLQERHQLVKHLLTPCLCGAW